MDVQLDTASRYILVHMCGDIVQVIFPTANLPLEGKIFTANILRVCLDTLQSISIHMAFEGIVV